MNIILEKSLSNHVKNLILNFEFFLIFSGFSPDFRFTSLYIDFLHIINFIHYFSKKVYNYIIYLNLTN